MQVPTATVTGAPGPTAELTADAQGNLWLDGEAVLATSMWGTLVALTLTRRLVLVPISAYQQARRAYAHAAAKRLAPRHDTDTS
jgi:hypothetical protein